MKKITLLAVLFAFAVSAFALKPKKSYDYTPADFGMNYEEIILHTDDNLRLNAWFFNPAETSKKVMIVLDDGDGNMADNLEIINQFLSMGYHVLAFDYRGYGKSDHFDINEKFYIYPQFVKDVTAAINYVGKFHASKKQVELYGKGIGAGLAIGAGASNTSIRRVIADGPYLTFEHQKKKMDENDIQVIMPPVYDKYQMEPLYALEKANHLYGVLIIVGENDLFFNETEAKELVKVNKSKVKVYTVEEAHNHETFSKNKTEYFDEVKDFIQKTG